MSALMPHGSLATQVWIAAPSSAPFRFAFSSLAIWSGKFIPSLQHVHTKAQSRVFQGQGSQTREGHGRTVTQATPKSLPCVIASSGLGFPTLTVLPSTHSVEGVLRSTADQRSPAVARPSELAHVFDSES